MLTVAILENEKSPYIGKKSMSIENRYHVARDRFFAEKPSRTHSDRVGHTSSYSSLRDKC